MYIYIYIFIYSLIVKCLREFSQMMFENKHSVSMKSFFAFEFIVRLK